MYASDLDVVARIGFPKTAERIKGELKSLRGQVEEYKADIKAAVGLLSGICNDLGLDDSLVLKLKAKYNAMEKDGK